MTLYEHLQVLISIILGLAITHLLASVHKVVQAGRRVRYYWLTLLWTVLVFIAQVEWWWASFEFQHQSEWNFFFFLFVLLSPVTLYLAAAFVLPDVERDGSYDLELYYYSTGRWFFGMIALSTAFDGIRRGIMAHSFVEFGALSNLVSAGLLGTLAFSRNRLHHAVIALAVAGLFLFFIVSEALNLTS
jgi:hypothetical protein